MSISPSQNTIFDNCYHMCPLAECKIKKEKIVNKEQSLPMTDPSFTNISQNMIFILN